MTVQSFCKISGVVALLAALLLKPVILPALLQLNRAPYDHVIGSIPILSANELQAVYQGKRVLIIGGTRGVGRGVSLAVSAAGAHVTAVSRSDKSGAAVMEDMLSVAQDSQQQLEFIRGDIGTVASAKALTEVLADHVKQKGNGFDYLVVTAAVFPDWSGSLMQEDGLEKGFAIAVVGRYLIYRSMFRFMAQDGARHVLNVLASGEKMPMPFHRDLASGKRDPRWLLEAIGTWSAANEMMQIGLDRLGSSAVFNTTRVSTHPGLLVTDLHRNQGWLMDVVEPILVSLMGLTEEEAGVRQASILASSKLNSGSLSYVDQDMQGRLPDANLMAKVDEHLGWLWQLLDEKAGPI